MKMKISLAIALVLASASFAQAEQLGEVSSSWKMIGPNNKIIIEAYDDPGVKGVTCYVSRAKTGGISGAIGFAENTSDASIACRQIGAIIFPKPLPIQEEVFNVSTSPLFKSQRIVRIVDKSRNALIYMTYSDKLIDGSPKNSVTAVAMEQKEAIPTK